MKWGTCSSSLFYGAKEHDNTKFYPLIICNISILYIAVSTKRIIFAIKKRDMAKYINPFTDVGGMTRAERLQYDEALKKYRDTISVFEGVRMEGIMEGQKKGMEMGVLKGRMEGQKDEKIANARKMKAYGLALEMIADITGLTIDEVRDL